MEEIDTVILAGGFGTRLSEKTTIIPKPMIKLGSDPIIIHIIKKYLKHGFTSFIINTGYKYNLINRYFNKKSLNKKKISEKSFKYVVKINNILVNL